MRPSLLLLVLAIALPGAACSSSANPGIGPDDGGLTGAGDSSTDLEAETPGDAGTYPLGMNDVTMLAPLPAAIAEPVLAKAGDLADDGTPLVPRALFNTLVQSTALHPILTADAYDRLQIVAVRFDLCDRNLPGTCAVGADGRLRLVLQPLTGGAVSALDAGIHAFYSISEAEIPEAIARLRELARMQAEPVTSQLKVSPGLIGATAATYAPMLRAFVTRFGGDKRLVRLTINAQPVEFAQIRWALRGLEKKGGTFQEIPIVGTAATTQEIIFGGNASYDLNPATDTPAGLVKALSQRAFDASTPAEQRQMLDALAAAENPLMSAPDTVACIACHASTVAMQARSRSAGVDPRTLGNRYSSDMDLSITAGKSALLDGTLRALGYAGTQLLVSQRVVNDTAQVLTEIDARFRKP